MSKLADKVYLLIKNPPKKSLEGEGVFPDEYVRFYVMREMGWTYNDYNNQPTWLVDQVVAFMNAENKGNRNGTRSKS